MEFKESNRNRNRIFRLGFKNFRTKTYKSSYILHLSIKSSKRYSLCSMKFKVKIMKAFGQIIYFFELLFYLK